MRLELPMLPEFPIAKEAITAAWNKILFKVLGFSDPLLSQVQLRVQKEGNRATVGASEIVFRKCSTGFQWKPEVGKGMPFDEFFGVARRIGSDLARQQAEHALEAMSEPGPHHVFFKKADGAFTFDDLLAQMERMEIYFDAKGMPRLPSCYVNPSVLADIQQNPRAWQLTEERSQRLAAFVAKKRKEFDEREARRRLVD